MSARFARAYTVMPQLTRGPNVDAPLRTAMLKYAPAVQNNGLFSGKLEANEA